MGGCGQLIGFPDKSLKFGCKTARSLELMSLGVLSSDLVSECALPGTRILSERAPLGSLASW